MNKFLLIISLALASCISTNSPWHGGSDSDKNGIRDDIDKWINDSFSSDQKVHKAMLNLASQDPALCDYKYHIKCLSMVSEDSLTLQLTLLEKLLNSDDRRNSFEKRVQNCKDQDDRNLNLKCDFN